MFNAWSIVSAPHRAVRAATKLRKQIQDLERQSMYSAIGQLHMRNNCMDRSEVIDLRTSELRVFSQNGEDGIIHALLTNLDACPLSFVEFGVGDGSESNTRLLAEVFGWSGLYIEPNHQPFERLEARFRNSSNVTCLERAVTPENVNDLFALARVDEHFGLLSIDVDGQDYWLWDALAPEYVPEIVVVECNSGFQSGSRLVESKGLRWSRDFGQSWGASIAALEDLGRSKGYSLVHVDVSGVNAFFVRSSHRAAIARMQGHVVRSPNYYLQGRGHPKGSRRPTVELTSRS